MFRKAHIYLEKFQESFLSLVDTHVQTMEMGKGTRQEAAWGCLAQTEILKGIHAQEKRVQSGQLL